MLFSPKNTLRLMLAAFACTCSMSSTAHERFIVPSHTQLSGEEVQSVTLTASISNAIFHPDRPYGDSDTGAEVGDLKTLFSQLKHVVITPDAKVNEGTRWQAFSRLSVADVELKESGTYRIGLVQPDMGMTTFKKSDGTFGRVFGAAPAPKGATDVVRRTSSSRVETFVTYNAPTFSAVTPTGHGVELAGETHPNDLFSGEEARFQLFYDGKPFTEATHVKLIRAGTRHRNDRQELSLTTSEDGSFSFTPVQAGFYFLGAELAISVPQPADVDVKHYSLYLTLEVFPE